MRLNFSGFGEDQIREGIRRIGKVVSEQVALYETITGEHRLPTGPAGSTESPAEDLPQEGDVVPLRRRRDET
jgi:2-aminoadipate transaminase